jgi:hypothetical protein
MRRLCWRAVLVVTIAAAAGAGAVAAHADGLPVLGIDVGGVGVSTPSGAARYVTIAAGAGRTVVARVQRDGGRVDGSNLLAGRYTIPAVAYDGSASGITADGKKLLLIEPRAGFPRAETRLVLVDTKQLRILRRIRLRGDFSFDAISPHGAVLYLIQYVVPTDPNRYLVRAYDLRAGRLLTAPVTDPRERGEKMHGRPLTRSSSPDGRWAYTLYDGVGGTPFVHALDTSRRTARCIDLDALAGIDLSRMRFTVDAAKRTLLVRNDQTPVVRLDTRTFGVSKPALPSRHGTVDARGVAFPWALFGLSSVGVSAVLFGFIVALRRRRRALALVP